VAIKVLPASFLKDPDRLKRIEQEARSAGVLNHPNLAVVYDIGQHDGPPYVVSLRAPEGILPLVSRGSRIAWYTGASSKRVQRESKGYSWTLRDDSRRRATG